MVPVQIEKLRIFRTLPDTREQNSASFQTSKFKYLARRFPERKDYVLVAAGVQDEGRNEGVLMQVVA